MSEPGPEPLSPRAARLAAALEQWPRRTVSLSELWALYADADPASTTRPDRRVELAATLSTLAGAGALRCSKTQDTTATPPLPTRLTLPTAAPTATAGALANTVPWRPELSWATSARLTVGQVGLLHTVNGWLRDRGRDDDVAPLRERSLEIFGREKQLDRMLPTTVFAPGRLTLTLLRTFRTRPPLPSRRLGDGPTLLVVENSDTFDTLSRVLTADPGIVGRIAWGAGAAFESSVMSAADLTEISSIIYFGDLDADGLRIPASAAALARAEGLPAVVPATALYQLLLSSGRPQHGQQAMDADRAVALVSWLDAEHRPLVAELLQEGCRIPQETVTARLLSATSAWRKDIGERR